MLSFGMATLSRIRRRRRRSRTRMDKATARRPPSSVLRRLAGRRLARKDPIEAVRAKLSQWVQDEEWSRMATTWARTAPPDIGLDSSRPRWAMVLTCPPAFMRDDKRGDCQMLMGLAPLGAAPADWQEIKRDAEREYRREAARLEITDNLTLYGNMGFKRAREAAAHDPTNLLPRLWEAMPGYSLGKGSSLCFRRNGELFAGRRARRRLRSAPPLMWRGTYGSMGSELWAAGMSHPREARSRFDGWSAMIGSMARAMEAHGMHARLCEGFFSHFPDCLDDLEAMARVDHGRLDPLRAGWAMAEAASTAASNLSRKAPRRSL